jgi:hypothetical protein
MKRAILMLATLSLLFGIAGQAKADITFNDYGPEYTYLTNAAWAASPTIGGTANEFTASVTDPVTSVYLGVSQGNLLPTAITVDLMTNNGGEPGTILEQYSFTNVFGTPDNPNPPLEVASVLHPVLTAGTSYWLAILPGTPTSPEALWYFNNQGYRSADALTTTNGGTWSQLGGGNSSLAGAFEIFGGSSPTPEPATITLLASGIFAAGGLGLVRRRRAATAR